MLTYRIENEGKLFREITRDVETLEQVNVKKKGKKRRNVYRKVSMVGYEEHHKDPTNGGYSQPQIMSMWAKVCKTDQP